MNCETRHIHNIHCLSWLEACCCLRTGHNMLLYFMDDFSRARLWTGALRLTYLAPRLRELDTTVVLVGEVAEDERLAVAASLAEELGLPFALVADRQRILWRRYGVASSEPARQPAALVAVDALGRRVGHWPLQAPEQRLDLPALLTTLEAVSQDADAARGHSWRLSG